jgi:hunchback
MHQAWENYQVSLSSTSVMSNKYDQQHSTWFNSPQPVRIKEEPTDFSMNSSFIHTTPHETNRAESSSKLPQSTIELLESMPSFRKLGVFNPLTPPGYSGLLYPSFLGNQQVNKQLTPSKAQDLSKSKSSSSSQEMDKSIPPLIMDVTPPKSPALMEMTPEKEDHHYSGLGTRSDSVESYDEESDEFEENGCESSKKRKSSNKPRQYKCKQCKQVFFSKATFWEHTRSHIKPEKMLQCQKCAFVTEYKHHLEYHLRNHSRSKPFTCPHCSYSCVNKSMLNSHLKSHSTVLQYRCIDCNYATKYCHSLKLHLRKYDHKPDIVLNLDGTPNPLPIIDVYGTRRGPKSKSTTTKLLAEIEKNQAQQQAQQQAPKSQLSPPLTPSTTSMLTTSTSNSLTKTPPSSLLTSALHPNAAMMVNMLQNKMPLFPYFNLNFQMFAAQQQHQQQIQKNDAVFDEENSMHGDQDGADTSYAEPSPIKKTPQLKSISRKKRKGKAFKFEEKINSGDWNDEDDLVNEEAATISKNESVTSSLNTMDASSDVNLQANDYECKFCGIIFKDNVLFSLHIGYHSLGNDPFKCNMCGTKTKDKIQFFLHIAKFPHS